MKPKYLPLIDGMRNPSSSTRRTGWL